MDNNVEKKVILASLEKIKKRLAKLRKSQESTPEIDLAVIEKEAMERLQQPRDSTKWFIQAQKTRQKLKKLINFQNKNWEKLDKEEIALMAEERTLRNRLYVIEKQKQAGENQ